MWRVTTVKLNTQFYSVFIDISSWTDLRLNNVYKSYNYITKMDVLWKVFIARSGQLYTIGKLENNLTLLDDTRPIRPRTARSVENIAAVNESYAEDPEESIRRWSQQLLGRFLMPEIEARNLHDIWFQQDGATFHTARETMDLLRSRFG